MSMNENGVVSISKCVSVTVSVWYVRQWLPGAVAGQLTPHTTVPSPSSLDRCTVLTHTRDSTCDTPAVQVLWLSDNKIGDAGVTALANACASGSLAQLTVSSHPSNPLVCALC